MREADCGAVSQRLVDANRHAIMRDPSLTNGVDAAYDACHSSVRESQVTRGVMSIETEGKQAGKILLAQSSDAGSAATREDKILVLLLEKCKAEGIDIASVVLDESSARAIVRKTMRLQRPGESEAATERMVDVLIDVWHSKKSGYKGTLAHCLCASARRSLR